MWVKIREKNVEKICITHLLYYGPRFKFIIHIRLLKYNVVPLNNDRELQISVEAWRFRRHLSNLIENDRGDRSVTYCHSSSSVCFLIDL